MNTNRVTLSAFGTTGVLLAASLTMLAIVSALVTFDAWPTRDRGASPAEIAVQNPHAARLVHTGRRVSATTGSRAVGGGLARGARAARLPGEGGRDGGGGGDPSNPNDQPPPSGGPAPPPHVGPQPPGEGDPDPGSGGGGTHDSGNPSVVHEVTCGAGQTISGVNGAAGAAVGSACKPLPASDPAPASGESDAPSQADAPAQVEVDVPPMP
jgi:hypothetical protein